MTSSEQTKGCVIIIRGRSVESRTVVCKHRQAISNLTRRGLFTGVSVTVNYSYYDGRKGWKRFLKITKLLAPCTRAGHLRKYSRVTNRIGENVIQNSGCFCGLTKKLSRRFFLYTASIFIYLYILATPKIMHQCPFIRPGCRVVSAGSPTV